MDPQFAQDQYTAQLEDELHRLRTQMAEMEDEVKDLQREHERELEELRVQNAELLQKIQDLAYGTGHTVEE